MYECLKYILFSFFIIHISNQILGLVDAANCKYFDGKIAQLADKWERLAPGFHLWFMQRKAETFKSSMIAPVREAAQLGSPPQIYTDNANESKNFVLKEWVDFSKNTIPAFIAELRSFVQQSLVEAERAVYGSGEYYLSDEFKHLEVGEILEFRN